MTSRIWWLCLGASVALGACSGSSSAPVVPPMTARPGGGHRRMPGTAEFASEVLLTSDLVFVSTNLALYAINLDTHKAVWSYPIVGRLALSAQGVLYVAGTTTLTAINLK
jgi:hypothetical protein